MVNSIAELFVLKVYGIGVIYWKESGFQENMKESITLTGGSREHFS